jgi:hypothetical protein
MTKYALVAAAGALMTGVVGLGSAQAIPIQSMQPTLGNVQTIQYHDWDREREWRRRERHREFRRWQRDREYRGWEHRRHFREMERRDYRY